MTKPAPIRVDEKGGAAARRHLNLRRRSDHRPTAGPEMDEAPDPGPGACHTREGELNRTLGDAQTAVLGVKPVSRRLRLTPVSSGHVHPGVHQPLLS